MWCKLAAALVIAAGPAAATGIEITVAGEGANGVIAIDLFEDVAPGHARQITSLAAAGAYDNVAFHRVIPGFMAQTGDVQFGVVGDGYTARRVGTGKSDLPNLTQEFSAIPFDAGVVGMARSSQVDSANSQFFIMFEPGYFLNNQYTVVGRVTAGQDVVNAIKKGNRDSGAITGAPDRMVTVSVTE
ncbi:peptidylprolyl isomerase [uncultured Tateyamaria sp.]|uniref:peptidylprolyl isomerase n=1 Tax=Tateyamaria sp. 1078 TaxID=3417464 RepID=UPI00260EC298|nr:peptidylprolyl isomerase [uncultured Tateyamaria sp.]